MGRSRRVLTIVRNEAVFFPIWLRYYSRFFAPEDIYVLDHQTTDGSTDVGGFVREPVEHEYVDMWFLRNAIQQRQNELIEQYDIVLVCDVDEIVAPDPNIGTLGEYLDDFDKEFVNCTGHELLHMKDREPPLDLDRPILEQRRHWFWNYAYSKPILATVAMDWHLGFHARKDGRADFDEDLHLIHLHRMDYDLCLERHRARRQMAWSEKDLAKDRAYQNRITDDEEFERWFYEDTCAKIPLRVEEIPAQWRDTF